MMLKKADCYVIISKKDGWAIAETTSRKAADEYNKTGVFKALPIEEYERSRASKRGAA